MVMMFPITWPISKLLDVLLGHHSGTYFRRSQLKELVKLHGVKTEENEDPLTHNEIIIIRGVLEMKDKTVGAVMTPRNRVFMLPETTVLTDETLQMLQEKGFSRIPIQAADNPEDIVGALVVKKLIRVTHEGSPIISTLPTAKVTKVTTTTPLFQLLNTFVLNNIHMGIVIDNSVVVGIITLEDLVEEMIQEEIEDDPMNQRVQSKVDRVRSLTGIDRKPSGITPIASPITITAPALQEPPAARQGGRLFTNIGKSLFKGKSRGSVHAGEEGASLVRVESEEEEELAEVVFEHNDGI